MNLSIDWLGLMPALIVLGAGVLGILVEAFAPRGTTRRVQIALAVLAPFAACAAAGWQLHGVLQDGPRVLMGGAYVLDGTALFLQCTVTVLAGLALAIVAERTRVKEDAFAAVAASIPGSRYEREASEAGLVQTEVYPLALFAVLGMMIFPAAGDLLAMFIAVEVLSLPLYLLSSMARRRRLLSQEAALKYFLLGSFASAFFLFGSALVYGATGTVNLGRIATQIGSEAVGMDYLLYAGVLLIAVGLLFKVGAVPFHSWTPDVYQGAPTPVTGFMAACTKVAAFGALLRLLYVAVPGLQWDLTPVLWTVAIATMLVGTVVAIAQTDIKRMLAYSAIAHAGFILTGVISFTTEGIAAALFYLASYGLTTIAAFGIVALVRGRNAEGDVTGEATQLTQWAGLGKRSPLLAGTFAFLLLGMAGIPLTAGFVGKFAVFSAAVTGGAWPLALIGVLASVIAAFFYARVIVLMFFTEPEPDSAVTVRPVGPGMVSLVVVVILTILLGLLPAPLMQLAQAAASFIA